MTESAVGYAERYRKISLAYVLEEGGEIQFGIAPEEAIAFQVGGWIYDRILKRLGYFPWRKAGPGWYH